ncbi:MAG TPA: ABC transporter substrate-binding protein [Burkholderiaceae bacterium]|nr:ABC transporter substrate-binding protein [Burkholderiaceae bacterium]
MLKRRGFFAWCAAVCLSVAGGPALAQQGPDALIQQLSDDVLQTIKQDKAVQAGNVQRIMELVDAKIMPHVNFRRMTASTVGRYWRQATPEQQQRLQEEFKQLLIRSYAGAVSQVRDYQVVVKPLRAAPEDKEVIVRTEVRGGKEPVQLDYRMENTAGGWKIYDVNVLGIWLVENYRSSFAQEISQHGIDGLISRLAERNKSGAAGGNAVPPPPGANNRS